MICWLKSVAAEGGSIWGSSFIVTRICLIDSSRPTGQIIKWVTDISYIHTKQGVLYLSMIRDLYDNSIVAHKTGTEQTINLVLDTIRLAMRREKRGSLQSCNSTATKAFNIHP